MINSEAIKKIDISNMFDVLKNFPSQVEDAVNIANNADLKKFRKTGINNIIITGLGGSAIGGDLIRSFTNYEIRLPVTVNRNYKLPEFADNKTLVIVSSYSGNTEETTSAYNDALKRKCNVICISSGGEVEKIASKNKHILIKVPKGYQPRCAIGYSFFTLLILFSRLGFISDKNAEIRKTIGQLKQNSKKYTDISDKENPAVSLADIIKNHLPVIYSSADILDIVNLRWRGQFSENSKILAYGNLYPEMNHNELVGWKKNVEILKNIIVIMIRDTDDNERIKLRMDITKKIYGQYSYEVIETGGSGESKLERIFDLIYLGDWISYYLAILNETDPTPVDVIENLKKELAKH